MRALAYLAVFGSVLAFGAYLTLMKRIGAGRAGYSMVAIPVVALLISTLLEHLQWTANAVGRRRAVPGGQCPGAPALSGAASQWLEIRRERQRQAPPLV